MKRSGFTMIELIFVIVILGILAAVAIPRLGATRDDAKIAMEMTNVAQVLQNLGAEYTSQGAFSNYTVAMANENLNCFTFAEGADGNVTLSLIGAATVECPTTVLTSVDARAKASGLVGNTGNKVYPLGGETIKQ